jgi:hypothetical protein
MTGKKGAKLHESVQKHQSIVIRQISANRAQQVANYRYLENNKVKTTALVTRLAEECQEQVAGKHVLAISDKIS